MARTLRTHFQKRRLRPKHDVRERSLVSSPMSLDTLAHECRRGFCPESSLLGQRASSKFTVTWKSHMLAAQGGKETCVGSRKIGSRVWLEVTSPSSLAPGSFLFLSGKHSMARVWTGKTERLFGPQFPLMSNRGIDNLSPLQPVCGQVPTKETERGRGKGRGRERENADNRMNFSESKMFSAEEDESLSH